MLCYLFKESKSNNISDEYSWSDILWLYHAIIRAGDKIASGYIEYKLRREDDEDDEDWSQILKYDENCISIPHNLLYSIRDYVEEDKHQEDLIVVIK